MPDAPNTEIGSEIFQLCMNLKPIPVAFSRTPPIPYHLERYNERFVFPPPRTTHVVLSRAVSYPRNDLT